jgi:hypothetical protein
MDSWRGQYRAISWQHGSESLSCFPPLVHNLASEFKALNGVLPREEFVHKVHSLTLKKN